MPASPQPRQPLDGLVDRVPGDPVGQVGAGVHGEPGQAGLRDLVVVAPDVLAVPADDVELVRDALRPEPEVEQVARVGVLRDEPRVRCSPPPPTMIGDAAHRLRVVQRPLEADRLPLERAVVVGEHPVGQAQGVLEQAEPLTGRGVGHAEPAVLLLVPRRPDAQPGAATGEHVERRDGLEQDAGVPVRHPGDQGAQLDPLGDGGRVRQRRVALEHVQLGRADHPDLEEVVHDPQRGQPALVGVPGHRPPGGTRRGGGVRPREPVDLESEQHRTIVPRRVPGSGQRYWPVLATVLIDLPGSVPSLVLMRVRM